MALSQGVDRVLLAAGTSRNSLGQAQNEQSIRECISRTRETKDCAVPFSIESALIYLRLRNRRRQESGCVPETREASLTSISEMRMCLILLTALGLQAQRPEYDFYRDGRDKRPEAYAEELRKAGVPEKEIARRLDFFATIEPSLRRIAGTASMAIQGVSTTENRMPFSPRWFAG